MDMGGDLVLKEGRVTPGHGEDLQHLLLVYAAQEREHCLDMPGSPFGVGS